MMLLKICFLTIAVSASAKNDDRDLKIDPMKWLQNGMSLEDFSRQVNNRTQHLLNDTWLGNSPKSMVPAPTPLQRKRSNSAPRGPSHLLLARKDRALTAQIFHVCKKK